ncbi:MAG: OmpA family protein [Alphaproteobacteria bacterium]|nr:OmpA family protein [Alphaproteobacteria bacterium]
MCGIASWVAAVAALLAVWFVPGVASAQALTIDGEPVEVPLVASDLFRPSIDATRSVWTDDASMPGRNTLFVRTSLYWVNKPFVWERGDESIDTIVGNAFALSIGAGYGLGRARVGVTAPVYLWSNGDLQTASGAALGDPNLDARVVAVEGENRARPGLAVIGRVGLPLGASNKQLGYSKVSWQLGLAADFQIDAFKLAANIGTHGVPPLDLGSVKINDLLWYKVGLGYEVRDNAGLSLDIAGHTAYSAFFKPVASPVEALLGGFFPIREDFLVQVFVGRGLTTGVGSPALRAGAALSYYRNPYADADLDGIPDSRDQCRDDPEDHDTWLDEDGCPDVDNDSDGFLDVDDGCPLDAEDKDDYEDHDGCPEGNALVTIELVSPDGEAVRMPSYRLVPRVGDPMAFSSSPTTQNLAEGSWLLEATADGMLPLSKTFEVPADGAMLVREIMQPEAKMGLLVLRILDPDGQPLAGTWKLDNLSYEYGASGGVGRREVPAGAHSVTARAPNYAPATVSVDVPIDGEAEVVVVLNPTRVRVTRERIDIDDKVYFEFDKAIIKPESYSLLDEVAQTIIDHPELLRIRIEGHTDSKGNDAYNMRLSQERADAVRMYFQNKGVEASRLVSIGFGETRPIDTNETEAGRANNRRVAFYIEERSD